MKSIGKYLNDLQEGEWTYTEGTMSCQGNYKNGSKEGEWLFFENNKLSCKGNFVNDKKEGDWFWFYPSGKSIGIGKYINGKEEGEWIGYYENSNLKCKQNFVGGEPEGEWTAYYENGITLTKGKYLIQTTYTRIYLAGYKEGEWLFFYNNGNLRMKGNYKQGHPVGEWICYYQNGQVKEQLKINSDNFANFVEGRIENQLKFSENGYLLPFKVDVYFGNDKKEALATYFPVTFKQYKIPKERKISAQKYKRRSSAYTNSTTNRTCPACQEPVPCGCNWAVEQNTK